ncbi:MAG: CoA transferase [Candidatus Binatia bacterium]
MAGLQDLRVLDLSSGVAGPFCARLLADGGADVIKIEDPAGGDVSRRADGRPSPLYAYLNQNKRGVALDLGTAPGRERFRRLAQVSDVVVESFAPRTLERLGLGYEVLAGLDPGIVLVSVTDFGQTGPYRDYRADHLTVSALGGWMATFGEQDREPIQVGFPVFYYMAGLYGAIGALTALWGRRASGKGQHVDVSAQEACLNTLSYPQVMEQYGNPIRGRRFSFTMQSVYVRATDGWVALNHLSAREWEDLCLLLGRADLLADPTLIYDIEKKRAIWPQFERDANAWARDKTRDEVFHAAQERRIPAGIPYTPPDMMVCEQFLARDFLEQVSQPDLGEFVQPCAAFRSRSLRPDRTPAPALGEHTADVLAELGVERAEMRARRDAATLSRDLLAGIRIVDLSHYRSGPTATSLLGGLGADVIKIEAMQRLDGFRLFNPMDPTDPRFYEMGSVFNASNTNKRGVTLDLASADGKRLFLEIVEQSDVVIENFSPRVMGNLGLEYARLAEINPRLIMVSMSSFGQTGPWRDFVGFGYVFDQLGGAAAVSGYEDDHPFHMMAASDVVSGILAVYAILLALHERERDGRGQLVDMSQVESLAFLLGPDIIAYQLTGEVQRRMGNRHPLFAPHNAYPCRGDDEWATVSVESDAEWAALARAIGRPQWADDPRFATAPARKTNEPTVDAAIGEWTRGLDKRAVMEVLQSCGVAAGAVLKPVELLADPQLEARAMHKTLARAFVGEHRYPQFPIHFSDATCEQRFAAPTLGQHNAEVLTGLLGLTTEEIERLRAEQVIGTELLRR